MRIKKIYVVLTASTIAVLLCIAALVKYFEKDIWEVNSKLLQQKVISKAKAADRLELSDITPFEWDKVYSFSPYTPKDKVYAAVGYKWDDISETVSEDMYQIVFLKNEKVVCYLYGYPSNNGYGILFDNTDYKDGIAILSLKDNLNFDIIKNKDVLYLRHIINNEKQTFNETIIQANKKFNTRVVEDEEFKIGNKSILRLRYFDLIKIWGKPKEIKKVKVFFPATVEPSFSYVLKYDDIDIEMYPVEENISIEATESFRFDITSSKYDFYGVKVGMSLEEYLKRVENKDVYAVKEILNDITGEKVPQEYIKLLKLLKENNYYVGYDKAIYEQVVINGFPYGAVMLFKNDILSRIVYGFPNAS